MIATIGNKQSLNIGSVGYTTQATTTVLTAPTSRQLYVHDVNLFNANSLACDVAVGVRLGHQAWRYYVVAAGNVNNTTALQAGSATNLFDTTNNHGAIVQAQEQFGMLVLQVSQVQTGSPTYSYQYWNGSAWATLPLLATPDYTSAATTVVVFQPPSDWVQGSGGAVGNLNSNGGYCIKVLATAAPTQAVQITSLEVSTLWAYRNVASKASLRVGFSLHPLLLDSGKSIQPYFQTANALNSVEFSYQVAP